jgi:hypothetical protein
LLVEPPGRFPPFMPLLVESALGSTVFASVADFDLTVLVANVSVLALAPAPELASASSERKMSASDGAGTVTLHVFEVESHGTVLMSSAPMSRPSEPKGGPSVCPAQVMFPVVLFVATLGARRYLYWRQFRFVAIHTAMTHFTVTC